MKRKHKPEEKMKKNQYYTLGEILEITKGEDRFKMQVGSYSVNMINGRIDAIWLCGFSLSQGYIMLRYDFKQEAWYLQEESIPYIVRSGAKTLTLTFVRIKRTNEKRLYV